MNVESAIWTFAPLLGLVGMEWLGRKMFGGLRSARFWANVAVATGLFGLMVAPRCLCSDTTDLVVGSSLFALVLGVFAYVLVGAAVLVMDRLGRSSQQRS